MFFPRTPQNGASGLLANDSLYILRNNQILNAKDAFFHCNENTVYLELGFWIKSLFSPHEKIYGHVHLGRQPEVRSMEKKNLKIQWGKKGT